MMKQKCWDSYNLHNYSLYVEGEAGESVKTGGLSEEVLGDKLTVVEFPDMKHGWTMRGNLEDPNIARDVQKAKELALQFFENNLN